MIHDPGKLKQQLREAAGFLRAYHATNTDELADACEEAAEEFYALACANRQSDTAVLDEIGGAW